MTVTQRPVTYATEQEARAYVARIMAAGPVRAPAYLAAAPSARMSAGWPELAARAAALLPGAELHDWTGAAPLLACVASPRLAVALAETHSALVVFADRAGADGRRTVGPGILAESEAFTAAGRPVLVFTGRRMAAWPDVLVTPVTRGERRPRPHAVAWVDVPAPPGRPLPTLAASLRVLGITGAADAGRASAGIGGPGARHQDGQAPPAMFRAAAGQ